MSVDVGQTAPDFGLRDQDGRPVRLSSFRGEKDVLLMFYPMAFTGTCTAELCALRDRRADFSTDTTQVLSVSCDAVPTLKAFADAQGLQHPLLSDFWPHGEVATAYGAFLPELGFATRATFLVDREGVVRWKVVTSPGEARSADDYRAALDALA